MRCALINIHEDFNGEERDALLSPFRYKFLGTTPSARTECFPDAAGAAGTGRRRSERSGRDLCDWDRAFCR